jgi:hypothetical protein
MRKRLKKTRDPEEKKPMSPSQFIRKHNKFHPTKSKFIDIYRKTQGINDDANDPLNTSSNVIMYHDIQGRVYTKAASKKNKLYKELMNQDEIDDKKTQLFWVFLPYKRSGQYVDNSLESKREPIMYSDDKSSFADVGDKINLYITNEQSNEENYELTNKPDLIVEIESYPERIDIKTIITSVIVSIK